MNAQKHLSLKQLLALLPPGAHVDSRWLTAHGVLRSSLAQYTKAGWLKRVAHGLYRRPETQVDDGSQTANWRDIILAAQALMGYPIHIGGMTALRELGHAHDVTFGARWVHIYSGYFPGWLRKLPTDEPLLFHTTHAFGDDPVGLGPATKNSATDERALPWWKRPLQAAEPERAILEALDELPDGESFTTLDRAFESLVALRPQRLEIALGTCSSVKAKRLFFVFAERHGHAWLKHLDLTRVNLGKGDRSLVKGGKLHPTWRITVPANLIAPASAARHGG
jgi:hypothetical protein